MGFRLGARALREAPMTSLTIAAFVVFYLVFRKPRFF